MSDQNTPDYGTRPEPKYGQHDDAHRAQAAYDRHIASGAEARPLEDLAAELRSEPRRDAFGIFLALIFLTIAGLAAWGAMNGGWWSFLWIVTLSFGLFGLAGLVIDGRKVPRDENGRPLR